MYEGLFSSNFYRKDDCKRSEQENSLSSSIDQDFSLEPESKQDKYTVKIMLFQGFKGFQGIYILFTFQGFQGFLVQFQGSQGFQGCLVQFQGSQGLQGPVDILIVESVYTTILQTVIKTNQNLVICVVGGLKLDL